MNNLLVRIISALVMLPLAVALILLGGWAYTAVILLLAVLILMEWNSITNGTWKTPLFFVQAILVVSLGCVLKIMGTISLIDLLVFLNAVLLTAILGKKDFKFAVAGGFYALLPVLSLIWLREYLQGGAYIILWAMIIVWSMDTGAYFAGKKIGGPKMSPKISPNKTWAGLAGGALLALITGTVSAKFFGFEPLYQIVVIAVVLAIWSQIGDLAESAVKRKFKVKDSGAIIPGHGGILDRVDGILFVMPVVALYLYFGG